MEGQQLGQQQQQHKNHQESNIITKPIAKGPANNPNAVCMFGIALAAPDPRSGLLIMPEIS